MKIRKICCHKSAEAQGSHEFLALSAQLPGGSEHFVRALPVDDLKLTPRIKILGSLGRLYSTVRSVLKGK